MGRQDRQPQDRTRQRVEASRDPGNDVDQAVANQKAIDHDREIAGRDSADRRGDR